MPLGVRTAILAVAARLAGAVKGRRTTRLRRARGDCRFPVGPEWPAKVGNDRAPMDAGRGSMLDCTEAVRELPRGFMPAETAKELAKTRAQAFPRRALHESPSFIS